MSEVDREAGHAGGLLEIDLAALVGNWQRLRARLGAGTRCGAVVKADAYGLGARAVAPALAAAGCEDFFVAHLDEGIALRAWVPAQARIRVMHGVPPGAEAALLAHGLTPVLNSLQQLEGWLALALARGERLPAWLQVDTGMARMGLADQELATLLGWPDWRAAIALEGVMSHLACAETPGHPANPAQLARFRALRAVLPDGVASLANSSGIFLGPAYHFDLVRPGIALYGGSPLAEGANPMQGVVVLRARVIQTRRIAAGTPVGYGQGWVAPRPARIATVAAGYADGLLRSLGNRGCAWHDGVPLPIVGRVSMDTLTLDASALGDRELPAGSLVELIGAQAPLDAVAAAAGTISYEILTALGPRYARRYLGA